MTMRTRGYAVSEDSAWQIERKCLWYSKIWSRLVLTGFAGPCFRGRWCGEINTLFQESKVRISKKTGTSALYARHTCFRQDWQKSGKDRIQVLTPNGFPRYLLGLWIVQQTKRTYLASIRPFGSARINKGGSLNLCRGRSENWSKTWKVLDFVK